MRAQISPSETVLLLLEYEPLIRLVYNLPLLPSCFKRRLLIFLLPRIQDAIEELFDMTRDRNVR